MSAPTLPPPAPADEYGLLVAFPDQSESFTLGFEAGEIWRELNQERPQVLDRGFDLGLPVHTANVELVARLATAAHYLLEIQPTDLAEWTAVRLTAVARARPFLSVVP